MTQEARSAAPSRKKTPPVAARSDGHSSTTTGPAFQQYQAAVQLLQQGKFERAMAAFEKLLPTAPMEIKERCKMYMTTCQRQLDRPSLTFATPEEHYDYAVSQLNTGYYEEAREQFNSILAGYPDADYAFYGLAVLEAVSYTHLDVYKRQVGTCPELPSARHSQSTHRSLRLSELHCPARVVNRRPPS